jgi:hypothetical protein
MSLNFQVAPIAFTQGQDTRTQSKLVVPGKWLSLSNMSISQDGTPRRRYGLTATSASSTGNGLALHGNELLTVNGSSVASYSTAESATVAKSGTLANVNVSLLPVKAGTGSVDSMDVAYSGAVALYAWRDLSAAGTVNGINYTLVDQATGTKILDNAVAVTDANAICPRVVYDHAGGFIISWLTTTGGHKLQALAVTTAGAFGAATTLVTDANIVVKNFDACFFNASGIGFNNQAMVVCRYNDGVSSVVRALIGRSGTTVTLSFALTQTVTAASVPTANIWGIAVATYATGVAGVFIVETAATPGIVGTVVDANFNVSSGPTVVAAFTQVATESHITATQKISGGINGLQVFSDQVQSGAVTAIVTPISTVTVGPTLTVLVAASTLCNSNKFSQTYGAGAANGVEGPWICGKAFSSSSNTVTTLPCFTFSSAGGGNGSAIQNAFFTLDGSSGSVVAKALYGSFGNNPNANLQICTPCSSPSVGSGFLTAVPQITNTLLTGNASFTVPLTQAGLSGALLTPNTSTGPQTAQLGPTTFFAGGQLCAYDGSSLTEHGFNLFPENVGVAIGAGGTVTDGVHQVVAVYEWVDANGGRHQSSPSTAASVTAGGGNNTITAKVATLQLTQKSGVTIAVYMTTASGLTFFRVTNPFTTTLNTKAAVSVTITVTTSDTTLVTNEVLYNQPNEAGTTLPNDAPPPCSSIFVSRNRLWLLSEDSPLEYRYSQELLNGFGLQFAGLFGDTTLGGLVPAESGGTVSIAALDEKTVIFCARKIYVVYGDGPNPSGGNNNFSEPQEIPSDVGCQDVRSVLVMPNGIIFKSQKGWHLLGRDLSVRYIGEGVAAYDGTTCTSAVLMADRKECRFNMQNVGATLVYSYYSEPAQWSVFLYGGGFLPAQFSDAIWWPLGGSYTVISPTAGINAETVGVFDDNIGVAGQTKVTTTAQTSWLRPGALEGFQRVRMLFLSGTPIAAPLASTLTMTVDFDDTGFSSGAYTKNIDMSGVSGSDVTDLRHKLAHQKCKSVRFTFSEVGNTLNANVLLGIQAMALEVGLKKGVNRLPAAQSVG